MDAAVGPSLLIGRELGHYRIVEKIGEGGMGEVFLAHDEHLGHGVALKILPSGTDDHSRHLFRKEAHALSKLNHPNIVTVLDFDRQEDLDFLVMEYVPGQALDERVREGALPEKEVIEIGIQLAQGLAAAHDQGVVHRDLKPGNLRLTHDHRLKILDFGLARSTLNFSPIATTLSIDGPADCSGTLPYMAPEQVLGQAADARTDIYSAGAVLYELCTGRPPFEQRLLTGMVEEILHAPVVPPSRCQHGISRRLEAIILRCLAKNRDQRYTSAQELAEALQELKKTGVKSGNSRLAKSTKYIQIGSAVVAVLLCVLGWALWRSGVFSIPGVPQIESLAVLPFANLSGDPQQEYLADGITDFLITDLGQMHILQRVISRTSVIRYKTERQPLREVAHQLSVDAVIEGSVIRAENTLHVTVRLVAGADDRQLWSRSYESDFRDLLPLQHELALAIASEVRRNVEGESRQRMTAARTVEPAVQEAYLKGKYLQFGTAEQRAKAREYFEKALQRDASYAPAYAGLADSYWNDIGLPAREAMPKAREYALKAISLDQTLAHAHTALATVHFYGDWDWASADLEYQRALQLNPNDAEAHRMYSVFLAAMSRADEALAQVVTAQELDPLNNGGNTTAGWDLYCAQRYDQALAYCQKAVELAPNDETSHACLSWGYLGTHQYRLAVDEAKKAWMLSGYQPVWAVLLGQAYARSGNQADAHEMLTVLLKLSRTTYIPPTFIAVLYAALGNTKMALQWMDKAYEERDLYLVEIKVNPAFDPLRSNSRFQALSKRMGLSP